jgi:CRISPR-associated protein Cmr5
MTLTIQQQRAQFALQRIQQLRTQLPPKQQTELISYCSGLPAMIHRNGLGQAMAFCKLKGTERDSYQELYQLVSDWLCQPGQPYAGQPDILTAITHCDRQHYQLAQAETMMLMDWVKKFAKTFLQDSSL